jgi:hypothetical protein
MKEQGLTANAFNKTQRIKEVWRKAIDQEEMMRPAPAVVEEARRRKQKYLSH